MLDGYKTYLAAAAGIIVQLAGLFGVDVPEGTRDALSASFGFLALIFMRFAHKKTDEKVSG